MGGTRKHMSKKKLANDPTTSPDILAELAKHNSRNVMVLVAHNISTPPEVLDELSNDHDLEVVIGVASNPRTPSDCLARMASTTSSPNTLDSIACNPSTTTDVLDKIVNDNWNNQLSPSVIGTYNGLLADVAKNIGTPIPILTRLASSFDWKIRSLAITNPTFMKAANSDNDLLQVFKNAAMSVIPRIDDMESLVRSKIPPGEEIDEIFVLVDIKAAVKGYPNLVKAVNTILTFG